MLKSRFGSKKVLISPAQGMPLYERVKAELLAENKNPDIIHENWFSGRLRNYHGEGVLCIIIEEQGAESKHVGNMMLVNDYERIGTLVSEIEAAVIRKAKAVTGICEETYNRKNTDTDNQEDTSCHLVRVLFIPCKV